MARSWRARRETSIPARLGFSSRIAHTRHAARHRSPIYRIGAEAPLPLIPAHSASKTRVNALMLGIQNCLLSIRDLGPRFRGDERIMHGFHAAGTLAAATLLAIDKIEQQSARHKASQRRRHAVGKARNDHATALLEAAIAVSRHLLG